jgi:hypothetical protein
MGSIQAGYKPAAFILLILLWVAVPLSAQSSIGQQAENPRMGQPEQQGEPFPKDIADKMAKEQLKGRYDNLKRDSEKLLELATELKQYVDKSGENTMSLEVIRKCEEIEKLSKSVRTKMKGD